MINSKQIQQKIRQADSLEILIGINVLLFLFSQIFSAFGWFSLRYVALPYEIQSSAQLFRLLTYGFFHSGFVALFINMLLLFYLGSILLDFVSGRKLWQLYLSGVIIGGVFFAGAYKFFPDMYVIKSPLLGASAGVMAVMTYTAMLMPHYQIKIRFLGYFKLVHILLFFIFFNLLQIPLGNPGGYFAHLGGLTVGFILFLSDKFFFEKKTPKSKDIFKIPKTKRQRKIDAILDKINRSGYESLTQDEKEELFRQSNK